MRISFDQLAALLAFATEREELSPLHGMNYLVVELADFEHLAAAATPYPDPPPCPVIGLLPPLPESAEAQAHMALAQVPCIDLLVSSEESLQAVRQAIDARPHGAAILVQLLRANAALSVDAGLFAESLAYSTLQHGSAFIAWLQAREPRQALPEESGPLVVVERREAELMIQLNRPRKRNAFSAALRDELHQALLRVACDDTLHHATVTGAGAAFCAGGDLTEFGEARDASAAHVARMTSNTGSLLHRLRDRVRFRLHGACIGAGIELPAFSANVSAAPDAFFQLPEMGFGLIPGAGGTVSITRRIGRHRAAYMALTGTRVDATTALSWGLIDRIE